MKTILIVAAHPDDEVLGCGGVASRFSENGDLIHVLILGEGITSRKSERNLQFDNTELNRLKSEAKEASAIIGAKSITILNFPDNRFDSVDLLDIVKTIEKKIDEINPQTIFTHHAHDLNIDHQITFQAVITACRPMKNSCIREVYSFEIPSSTEWQSQTKDCAFLPTQYIEINKKHLERKITAMQRYTSEIREYPHPRSIKALKLLAEWRGVNIGANYAEAFEAIRRIDRIL